MKKKTQLTLEFDVIRKFEKTLTTANELRTGIFAPIDKISANSKTYKDFLANSRKRTIETSWGKTIIKGNILTQTHRDLLDCIITDAKEVKELEGGAIAVYFSTTEILKSYSGKSNTNTKWLKDKLDEIQNSSIEFKQNNTDDYYSFSIIDSHAFSTKHNSFGLVFTPAYRNFFEEQLTINYKKELPKLLKVKSALLKSIIRFFWTHSVSSSMDILILLKTVGFPLESVRMKQKAVKEIKDNVLLLEEYGIVFEPKSKLIYSKNSFENSITFMSGNPNKKLIESKDNK
ncbi:hypothetical protein GJV85_13305 (plasmid) [Sulfurimonas aquatica]|uniref:Replication protein n=1 Tax=Sulfurimonas aquatica TaxID=2672570 RepID=A0A975GE05_9BACT|nr:hypothetical protein [Sulfurimonas aquatica]QSZ43147.1 hypothetical protein GJV85_13305 [Sulfurimonas aquatica]